MLNHRGFSAWIVSDGRIPFEFKTTIDHSRNVVTCWIPCEVGKKFTVHWRDGGGLVDTAGYIFLDGFEVPGYFLFGFGEAHRGAARVSPTLQRPFVFAQVDEDVGPYPFSPKSGGLIQLSIKRIKRVGASAPNAPRQPPKPVTDEKGHPVSSLGFPQAAPPQLGSTWNVEPYDPDHPEPYVTFEWRYRSLHYLVQNELATLAEIDPEAAAEEDTPPMTPASSTKPSSLMTPSPSPPGVNKIRRLPSYGTPGGSSQEGMNYDLYKFQHFDPSGILTPPNSQPYVETPEFKPNVNLE
ncbi:hypothetical protein QCA50_003041 [Cerrena zonata]|uniref:Uncharacterized protein n=1 Tax=Cerrena zonata TaxID=2478898 RepID=A0AAW0GJE0_9APHY